MTSALRPSGTYARWNGDDYPAVVARGGTVNLQMRSASPPPGFSSSSRGSDWWSKTVPASELDALDAVTTFARWRGRECVVTTQLDGDHVLLSDDGADHVWAEANAEFREPGVWDAVAPVAELGLVREEARDLLRSPT